MVATDPPYNPQLKLTMAGGSGRGQVGQSTDRLRDGLDDPADLANSATYPEYLDRMTVVLAGCRRVLRDGRIRHGHRA